MENEELLPVVNESGQIIDGVGRSLCHDGKSKLLHPVVHLHVVNPSGSILLQKRSFSKRIQPGRWDTAVGGHISLGESIGEALQREALEEIGLSIGASGKAPEPMDQYVFESAVERELVCTHIYFCDNSFIPVISEPEQIDELRFFSPEEIDAMIAEETVTPNFAKEYAGIVYPYILKRNELG